MTENVFRFEYSEKGTFENRPSLAIIKKNMTQQVKFKAYETGRKLLILTDKFNVTYVVGSSLKSSEDLSQGFHKKNF